jgi:hypothetical protein
MVEVSEGTSRIEKQNSYFCTLGRRQVFPKRCYIQYMWKGNGNIQGHKIFTAEPMSITNN